MMRKRLRLAFAIFTLATALSVMGGVLYLQSQGFANFVKKLISDRSDQRLGVVGDFKNLKLYFFPPGIGVASPSISVKKDNIAKIPIEAKIEAQEIRISFAPIQMFSGTLMVDEFKVVGGSITGSLGADIFKPTKKTAAPTKLHWNDLFKIQINGIQLEDTFLHLEVESAQKQAGPMSVEFLVKNLRLEKSEINQKPGFASKAMVSAVKVDVPKSILDLPVKEAYQVQWDAQWNDEGIKFSPLSVDIEGLNVKLNGKIAGNVLDEKSDLRLDSEAQLSSNLATFLSAHFSQSDSSGDVLASAKVTAKLRDFENTLKASYQVTGKDLAWKEMKVSYLHSDGVVNLAANQISIKGLNALSPVPEDKKSEPGEVSVENLVLPLKFDQPFDTKLKFKHADFHWLGGVVLKEIFMLEGSLNGEMKAHFTPGRPNEKKSWKAVAEADLVVDRFELTNRKLGVNRKVMHVLKPAHPVKVNGEFLMNANGVDFNRTTVQMLKTKLDVTGGVHPNKDGIQIKGSGSVDLKEMNEIAENPIRGTGEIKVDVHGPVSAVVIDFDADLKDSEYLDLKFGDLKGKITYDDDAFELRLQNIHARQRSTFYTLDAGFIDLGGSDEIHLPIAVRTGRVEDIAFILGSILKKIDWYPTSLIGEAHGNVLVGGKMDLARMQISSQLEGSDWALMGEKARKVKFNFGYDQGVYSASNVNLTKTNGQVLGGIEFNSLDDEMKWDFHTENFTLTDIDFVDRLQVPARSKIEVKSSGQGKASQLQSTSEAKFLETVLKGEKLDPTTFTLEMGEKTIRMKLDMFGNRLHSQMKYALTPKQPSSFALDLNEFDFSPVLMILNPKLMDDSELAANMNGHIQLDFLSTQAELARGMVTINKYLLQKSNFYLKLADPIELPIQLGFFDLKPARFQSKNAEFTIQGEGNRGNVDLKLDGKIDLGIAEFFSSSLQKISGIADATIRMRGPLKELKVNGDINFEGVYALMRWMQTPFEEVDGAIRIRQGVIYVEGVEAYLADEPFFLNGSIATFTDRFPKLDLKAQFDDNKVKLLPLDFVQAKGTAWIHGEAPPYLISGNIEVVQALYTKSFGNAGAVSVRGDRFAPVQSDTQGANSMFNLDLNVNANQAVVVRNEIMDAEFRGKVKIIGPPENPKMLGEANLVQGKILFRDRPFNLETVRVTLDDPLQFVPKYNVSAISEVNQYKIRLLASGVGGRMKAEFSSTPFLPENEIYSLLTSGMTSSDTGRFRSKDRTYVNQGEAASLILHSLDFSQDVQKKTGFQFDVSEAVDQQSASSVFRPQTLSDNIAAPKLVLKRNVGRNINLAVGSTVGVGTQTIREASAEYKLTPGMSFIGVWNAIEGVNTQQTRTSYGLDIRLNQKFK